MLLSYSEILNRLKETCSEDIRDNDTLYLINRYTRDPSLHLTVFFVWAKASPNFVTWLSLLSGLVGCVLVAFGDSNGAFVGSLFLLSWFLLDFVDGNLARYYGTSSSYGEYLDSVACYTVFMLFPVAIGVHIVTNTTLHDLGVWLHAACAYTSSMAAVFPRLLHQKKNNYLKRPAHYSENLAIGNQNLIKKLFKIFNNLLNPSGLVLPMLVIATFCDAIGIFNIAYGFLNFCLTIYCFVSYTILSKRDFG